MHYGLKPEHNISDFGSFLVSTDLLSDLTGTDSGKFDSAISRLTTYYFDDLHSGILHSSWRSGEPTPFLALEAMANLGTSTRTMYLMNTKFEDARKAAYPDGVPMYEEAGDTAFITFDSFAVNEEDESSYYDPGLSLDPSRFVTRYPDPADPDAVLDQQEKVDTIKLFLYAYQMITRENSPVKNVVIDLSNNGGGEVDAAVFVLCWILGRGDLALRNIFTGAQAIMSYLADVNLDHQFDEKYDNMIGLGLNVYVLTSPKSFSCGNLVPAACKMSGLVTLVGQPSGGGSCVVLPCNSASGTIFQISGSKQLSIVKNGSFYNIDEGVDPDIWLTKTESFYDREALAEYLKEIK